jgi:nitrogen fixation NifU-like protein
VTDLQRLYQDVVLDHHRRPRNFRALEDGSSAEVYNPLCGDRVTVYVRLEDDVVADAAFQGSGCAIVLASASLLTEAVKGLRRTEAGALLERVEAMLAARPAAPVEDLGALSALAGVRLFPTRVRCARLPWEALRGLVGSW